MQICSKGVGERARAVGDPGGLGKASGNHMSKGVAEEGAARAVRLEGRAAGSGGGRNTAGGLSTAGP